MSCYDLGYVTYTLWLMCETFHDIYFLMFLGLWDTDSDNVELYALFQTVNSVDFCSTICRATMVRQIDMRLFMWSHASRNSDLCNALDVLTRGALSILR